MSYNLRFDTAGDEELSSNVPNTVASADPSACHAASDLPVYGNYVVSRFTSPLVKLATTAGITLNLGIDTDRFLSSSNDSGREGGRNSGLIGPSVEATTAAASAIDVKASRAKSGKPTAPDRDALLTSAAALRFFVIVLEEKGGVGKSVCTQTTYETLKLLCDKVLLIDADIVNKNLSRMGLTEASDALNARRIDFEGWLFEAAERLTAGDVGGVVIDSAAGSEESYRPFLQELARTLRAARARLVVMRPMTTSPIVFDNILTFGRDVMTDDMGVLVVKNMSMSRVAAEWVDFNTSPERQEMLKRGMTEIVLEDAGVRYSDLATSFGRSFAQIALNAPEELGLEGRALEIAERCFNRQTRMFLARWLFRQTEAFKVGLYESVFRTL